MFPRTRLTMSPPFAVGDVVSVEARSLNSPIDPSWAANTFGADNWHTARVNGTVCSIAGDGQVLVHLPNTNDDAVDGQDRKYYSSHSLQLVQRAGYDMNDRSGGVDRSGEGSGTGRVRTPSPARSVSADTARAEADADDQLSNPSPDSDGSYEFTAPRSAQPDPDLFDTIEHSPDSPPRPTVPTVDSPAGPTAAAGSVQLLLADVPAGDGTDPAVGTAPVNGSIPTGPQAIGGSSEGTGGAPARGLRGRPPTRGRGRGRGRTDQLDGRGRTDPGRSTAPALVPGRSQTPGTGTTPYFHRVCYLCVAFIWGVLAGVLTCGCLHTCRTYP